MFGMRTGVSLTPWAPKEGFFWRLVPHTLAVGQNPFFDVHKHGCFVKLTIGDAREPRDNHQLLVKVYLVRHVYASIDISRQGHKKAMPLLVRFGSMYCYTSTLRLST